MLSFIGWEFLYKIKYYGPVKTISLSDHPPLTIDAAGKLMYASASNAKQPYRVEASRIDWKYRFTDSQGEVWGCEFRQNTKLLRVQDGQTPQTVWTFPVAIRSMHVTNEAIFVCAGGILYRSPKVTTTFEPVLQLTTSESYFLFNNGFTVMPDGTLLLGEYASVWQNNRWVNLAYLYISKTDGRSWETSDFLQRQGVNKHIHLVKYSPLLNQVFMTDGDNKKQLWRNQTLTHYTQSANRNRNGWHLTNRFHWQMGGYTSMLDHEQGVVFGTDYLGGTNFLVHTTDGRTFRKEVIPNPYRRSPVINMVARRVGTQTELWALLHNSVVPEKSCVLMYSQDNGKTWHRFIEYDGRQHEIQLVSSASGANGELYFCIRQWVNGQELSQTYRVTT